MNSIEKTLTTILTLAFLFFLSSSITKTNKDIHAENEKENAMKIASEEAKKKIKKEREEKTIHVQIVHDADPNTNTASVTLSSGNSYDPENDEISFNWTQISGETIEIEDPSKSIINFTAKSGEYEIQLDVTDSYGATCSSSKIINISKEKNQCPISEINQQIAENIEETELIE